VIVMTAWGSIQGAVEAMRRGARDYVEKPWDNQRLVSLLRTHVELGRALRESARLESENRLLRKARPAGADRGVARHAAGAHDAGADRPVGGERAVTGEHGTGKEIIARWLHAASPRAEKPLVIVNAGGLSEGVFESELFGHVKGAFTDAKTDRVGYFELADGGTLFLDEIGNMPPKQQAKLLRVLQTGEFQRVGSSKTKRVDVRVISATNVDIRQEVAEGRFREDLLYRLNTVEIHLPPLRDRPEDMAALAQHFLKRQSGAVRKEADGPGPRGDAGAAGAPVAGQHPRAGAHHGARGADGAGPQIRAEDLGLRGARDGAARSRR
jgi:DNA-binding NtrC family response regulator